MQFYDLLMKFLETGRPRMLPRPIAFWVYGLSVALVVFQFYEMLFGRLEPYFHNVIFMTTMLSITIVSYSRSKSSGKKLLAWDLGISLVWLMAGFYILLNTEKYTVRWPFVEPLTTVELCLGVILLASSLEVCYRTVGLGFTIIVLILFGYGFFGHHLPVIVAHREIPLMTFIDLLIYTYDGIFGVIANVAATYVFFFVIFGNFLNKAGGGELFYQLGAYLTGQSAGGPAKVSVISSALYGTISGSPTADVVTTGSFTIPNMKRAGYDPVFAGAVETSASTGGSILPPVMGTAVFVMAELTGIPYVEIAISALLPALLYYTGVYYQVHFRALRLGLHAGIDARPKMRDVLRNYGLFLIPLLVLVALLIKGYTPMFCCIIATGVVVVVSWLRKDTRLGPLDVLRMMRETILQMAPLIGVCSAAGLVLGVLVISGLPTKVISLIAAVSGNSLFIALCLTMLMCLVLGMGMPTTPSYVLTAVLGVPLLIKLGAATLQAHLFVIYYAVLSNMTPPVAVAAFSAAMISYADPYRTAVAAIRLSIVAYVLPFVFVYQPILLDFWRGGDILGILITLVTSVIGAVLLASALEGWFFRELGMVKRLLAGVGALLFFVPENAFKILALLLIVPFVLIPEVKCYYDSRRVSA